MQHLTNKEIEDALNMSEDELYNKIYNMTNYNFEIYPYEAEFKRLSTEQQTKMFIDFYHLELEAKELGCTINYPDNLKSERDLLFANYEKYNKPYKIIMKAIYDKQANCKHNWEIYNEYNYDITYWCTNCGKRKH